MGIGVDVDVGRIGVNDETGAVVPVETTLEAGVQDARTNATSKTAMVFLIFMGHPVLCEITNGLRQRVRLQFNQHVNRKPILAAGIS